MRTTQLRLVVGLLALGAAIGWTVARFTLTGERPVPDVPWSAAGALLFFAGVLGLGAWYMYDRVRRRRDLVDLVVAVRLLVLAKASALVGALVSGGYGGFGLYFVSEFDVPEGRTRVIRALVAAAAGVVVVVAALILERACKVPKGGLGTEDSGSEDGPEQPDETG